MSLGILINKYGLNNKQPPVLDELYPQNVTTDNNVAATFQVIVISGTAPFSYQWYIDDKIIDGATQQSYTHSKATAGTYKIKCVVSNADGQATSRQSIWINHPKLTVSISASATAIKSGQTSTLTATAAGGTGSYTYSWSSGGTASKQVYSYSSSGSKTITCTVKSGSKTATGSIAIECIAAPTFSLQASAATILCRRPSWSGAGVTAVVSGQTTNDTSQITMKTTNSGYGTITYQWQKDGKNISGATSNTYTATVQTLGANKTKSVVYKLNVTAKSGSVSASSSAEITITTKQCDWCIKLTSSGTLTLGNVNSTLMDVQLYSGGGGGGAGARYMGGGGGPGGRRSNNAAQTIPAGSYTITIGAGGAGSSTADVFKNGSQVQYYGTKGSATSMVGTDVNLQANEGYAAGKSAIGWNSSGGTSNGWPGDTSAATTTTYYGAKGGSNTTAAGSPGQGNTNYAGQSMAAGGGGGAGSGGAYSKGVSGVSGNGGTPYQASTKHNGSAGTANRAGGGGGGNGTSSTPGGSGGKGGSGLICIRNAR